MMSYSGSVHFENYDREQYTLNGNKILSTNINSVNDFKHNSHFLTLQTHSNNNDVVVSPNCNENFINFSAQRNPQSIFPEPIAYSNSMQSLSCYDIPTCSSVNNISKLNNNEFIVTNFQNEDSSSLDGDIFSEHREKQIVMIRENTSDTYRLGSNDAGKNISVSNMLEYGEKLSTERDLYGHIVYSSDRESLKETVDVSFTNDIANFQTFPSSPTKVAQDIDFVKDSYEKKFNSYSFPTLTPQPSRTYNYNTYIREETNDHKHNGEVLCKQNVSKNNTSISSIVDSKIFSDSKPHVMTNQRMSESVLSHGQTNSSFQCEQIPAVGVTNTKVFIPNIQETKASSEECEDFITHRCGSIHHIRMSNKRFTEERSSLTIIQQTEKKMTNLLGSIKSEDFAHSRNISKIPIPVLEHSMDVSTSESKSFICRRKQSYDNSFTTGIVVAKSASKILSGNTTSEKVTSSPLIEENNKCIRLENDLLISNKSVTSEISSEITRKYTCPKQTDSYCPPRATFCKDVPALLKVKNENSTGIGRLLCENLTSYLESNMEHTISSERTFTSQVPKMEFGDHEPCSNKSCRAENTSYIPTFITDNKENCSSETLSLKAKQNITVPMKIKIENSDSHTTKLVFKRSPFLNANKDTIQERREKQESVNESLVHGSVQSEIKSNVLKLNTDFEKSGSSETEKTSLNLNNHVFGNTVNEDFKDNVKRFGTNSSLPLEYMIEVTTAKEGVTDSILQENQFIDQPCSNGCFETSDISNFKANAKELVSSNTLHEKPSQNLPHSASIRKTEDEVRSDFSRQHFSLPGSTLPTNSTTEKFGTGKNQNMDTYENISLITSQNILDDPNIKATSSKSESPVINQTSLNQNTFTPLSNIRENVNDIGSKFCGNTYMFTKNSVSKTYSYKKENFDDQSTQSRNIANEKLVTNINTSDAKRDDFKSDVENTESCDESLFKVNFASRKCSQLSTSSNSSTKLHNNKLENVVNSLSNESDCMIEKISIKRDSLTHERKETIDRSVKLCNAINSEIKIEAKNKEPHTGDCSKKLTEGRSYLHEDQKETNKDPTQQNSLCDESANNKGHTKLFSQTEIETQKKKSYKCEKCGVTFYFTMSFSFEVHKKNCKKVDDEEENTKYQYYECKLCGFKPRYPSKRAIKNHMLIHSKERQHKCDECGKTFLFKKNLKSHQEGKHSKEPYICSICGKSYKSKISAANHLRNHQNELTKPEFPCDICGKSFNKKEKLKNHYRKHTGEKPYSCDICNRSFRVKNEMYRHRRIHSNERPYQCEICGKTFKCKEYGLEHKKMHTQCNDYKCNICGKTFNFSSNLNQHLRTHEDKRDHVCRLCDKKFKFPHHLRQHEQTHV